VATAGDIVIVMKPRLKKARTPEEAGKIPTRVANMNRKIVGRWWVYKNVSGCKQRPREGTVRQMQDFVKISSMPGGLASRAPVNRPTPASNQTKTRLCI
jgi:hypothetical protein